MKNVYFWGNKAENHSKWSPLFVGLNSGYYTFNISPFLIFDVLEFDLIRYKPVNRPFRPLKFDLSVILSLIKYLFKKCWFCFSRLPTVCWLDLKIITSRSGIFLVHQMWTLFPHYFRIRILSTNCNCQNLTHICLSMSWFKVSYVCFCDNLCKITTWKIQLFNFLYRQNF